MRKALVAINVTVDGYCDHTAVIADEELHNFNNKILDTVEISTMGRVTYQLMYPYWHEVARDKVGSPAENSFAEKLENIHKILVSRTIDHVNFPNTEIIKDKVKETVIKLKNGTGKNILIGGTTIINYLNEENLIDEFIFVVQPIILGKGKKLFSETIKKINLKLENSKTLSSGCIALHYSVIKQENSNS